MNRFLEWIARLLIRYLADRAPAEVAANSGAAQPKCSTCGRYRRRYHACVYCARKQR